MMATPEDCPCPLERKVLIQTMDAILQALTHSSKKRTQASQQCADSCVPAKRCPKYPDVLQGSECLETAVVPYNPLKQCKSSELRAGVFYTECRCLKRDGLQRACRRQGCSDQCGFVRPARRDPAAGALGSAVQGYSMQPHCCPGHMEDTRLRYLHAKADLLKRDPPLPPEEPPPPLPPPPPYNWTGTFRHDCRPAPNACLRPRKTRYPCGGAKCKHWEVPQPCTFPICRADCFEPPPGWPTLSRHN